MNAGKEELVLAMLRRWRGAAVQTAAIQWRCFFEQGRFDPFFDPATAYRKAGVAVRAALLVQIGAHYGLDSGAGKPGATRRYPKMAPGLVDPLAELKSELGAAQVQMVREQVLGSLNSYVSNRGNDFKQIVFGSSVGETTRHMLFVINKARAWFDLSRKLVGGGVEIPASARRLARKIMSHVMSRHRSPRMTSINMLVDQRIAKLSEATAATGHDMWLRMSVAKGMKIDIPLKGFEHFDQRRGTRAKSFQIIKDRNDCKIYVGVMTDVAESFEASREYYAATVKTDAVALDFGLNTMFATDQGDLLGRGFKAKLQAMDRVVSGIAKHVQRSGQKPRSSKRYCAWVAKVRGFITTEINRVINRLIEVHRPSKLYLEKLNFQSPGMSARMNGLIQNCGRAILRTKLAAISQEFGIEATEVASAYTSQTCSCCGYTDKRNRLAQKFQCRFCGSRMHADVNASRNVGSERFRFFGSPTSGFRQRILDTLVSQHVERYSWERGAPPDPRKSNPYFAGQTIAARLSLQEVAQPRRGEAANENEELSSTLSAA
ncbi:MULTISPECIES: zinc ribbon domain-containing protein [unclassified Rhizobium]